MQAVILAAGRGTRMKELTETTPKALLPLGNKTLLEYEFDALPDEVDEVIVIVGYLGSLIHERFGGEWNGKKIFYVEQDKLDGTAGALWRAKDILHDRFVVMMSDDLYARSDVENCIREKDWALLVQHRDEIRSKGKVEVNKRGEVIGVTEGDHGAVPGFLSTNLFMLDSRIFQCPMVPKAPGSEEFGLPQTAIQAAQMLGIPFRAVKTDKWLEITSPEDLKKAREMLGNIKN
ncbi:MAG TPA: nucleotidyltransferase family protein [Candidatus Paceibacterota bacterium]|nr:nucleotidyltransferase family protein [Candidatus Paceibacterota bacterium]